MADYTIHKAVELDKVKKKRQAVLKEPGYLERNYIAQAKYDGCNMVAIKSMGDVEFFSRTGERCTSVPHIAMAMLSFPGLPDGVYLGEAWAPDLDFPTISGLFRTKVANEETCRLQFAVFDYLTLDEWSATVSALGYVGRVARIPDTLGMVGQGQAPIWLAGSFGYLADTFPGTTAQDLCNKLVEVGGYDGAIFRDPQGVWKYNDNGSNGEIIKVKAKLSFDLRVVDYEEGKGKHAGKIGTLIVEFRGKRQGAGTGLKDDERNIHCFDMNWRNQIVEIECLGVTEDGQLREPRMKGVRMDKLEPDA